MQSKYKVTKLSCFTGYVSQAITVNLAPLLFVIFSESFKLSLSFIALIPLLTFLIQIMIDAAAVWFIERVNFRLLCFLSQIMSFCGLILLSFLPNIWDPSAGIIVSIFVYSSGSALAEVILSPLIDSIGREEDGSTAMTFLHSFYSWGQAIVIVVTTLVLKLTGSTHWEILPLMWSLIPLLNAVSFCKVPIPEISSHDSEHRISKMLFTPSFVIAVFLMVCAGATEQVMAQWASLFAEVGLGVSKVTGDIVGPCMFAVMMGIGRTLHGLFGKKLDIKNFLMLLSAFTVACYLLTIFARAPFMSLVGCGLSGLGVSVMWPGLLTMCSDDHRGGGAVMFAFLALGGDIGCSVGPYLSGSVSDMVINSKSLSLIAEELGLMPEQFGLRIGFFASLIFPVMMFLGVWLLKKEVKRKNDKIKKRY